MAFDYECPKCGHKGFLLAEMRGPSGGMSAYLNIDSQIVTLLVCDSCRYAEVYFMSVDSFKRSRGIEGDHHPEGDPTRSPYAQKWICECGYANDPTLEICASCNAKREPSKVVSLDDLEHDEEDSDTPDA